MKEIKQIIASFNQASLGGREAVLATVVHIEGSSYRGPGARMLITDEGQLTGAISGGCLESDIMRKALMVIQKGSSLLVTYDTSEEENDLFSVNLGCNGIISILLEYIDVKDTYNPIALLNTAIQSKQNCILATIYSEDDTSHAQQGTKLLFTPNRLFRRDGLDEPIERILVADISYAWEKQTSVFVQLPTINEENSSFTAFLEFMKPPISLVIAGAGNDVLPLVEMAKILGWETTIMDGRPLYVSEERFPSCQIVLENPENAMSQLDINENTAILLMSHNYDYDKSVLKQAVLTPAKYIGLLGPSKKRERILEELQAEGIDLNEQILAKLHAPVGLNLGSETSEEIALSIVSEIQSFFAGTDGKSLKNVSGNIHERDTAILPSIKSYGVIILAAGASKRMGSPKQAIAYKGGTLLTYAVHQALQLQTAATVVVIPQGNAEIKQSLEGSEVLLVENDQFQTGMASSIRMGLSAMMDKFPEIDYGLIMLCDQPYVDEKHLKNLILTQRTTQAKVTASMYEKIRGVPALFHRSFFDELLHLEGDTGAKRLIERLGGKVATVSFPLAAFDIDTPQAKKQLEQGEKL